MVGRETTWSEASSSWQPDTQWQEDQKLALLHPPTVGGELALDGGSIPFFLEQYPNFHMRNGALVNSTVII